MRRCLILILLAYYAHSVRCSTICDSVLCVCKIDHKSDIDDFSEIIDCSYYPTVLQQSYDLPSAVYLIDLSWNNLTHIDSTSLFKSSTLKVLFLNNNKIKKIGTDALQLPKLQRLDLSNNNLETVEKDTFKYINQLEYLNIANNRLHSMSEISLHYLGNLVEIVLDNNNIGPSLDSKNLFDRNGYGLTNKIKSLSISGINLNVVCDNFFVDAYDIRKLVISNNNLSEIFELPFTLEYLDLSNNPIKELSGEDFSEARALKELKLNNLWIREVPDYAFAFLPALTHLELERNNNLTYFSELAFGREVLDDVDDFALEKLSLRGSRLSSLSDKLQPPLGQLIHLDLQGNMWRCDCNLKWIKELQLNENETDHFRCYTPKTLYNSRIKDLNDKYFVCPVNRHYVGMTIGILTTCLLLTALAGWIYVFIPRNQMHYNMMKDMSMPTTGYMAVPMHMNLRRDSFNNSI